MLEVIIALLISTSNQTPVQPANFTSQSIEPVTIQTEAETIKEPINFSLNIPAERPYIQASSALVFDVNTNNVIFQENISQPRPIASLTKLMTAYIILTEHQLGETITITAQSTQVEPIKSWFTNGEQLTVQSVLNALLIQSANDAAYALAIHNSGSIDAFVTKMNNYAQKLELTNTSFSNPAGFDHPQNYSTALDLLKLTQAVLKYKIVTTITSKQQETITNLAGNQVHNLKNTNQLLNTAYQTIGLKTGTTPQAGQCLITLTNGETPLITVILNSPNRFQETKTMLDWAFTYLNN